MSLSTQEIAALWSSTSVSNAELAQKAGCEFDTLYNRIRKSKFWGNLKAVGRTPSNDIFSASASTTAKKTSKKAETKTETKVGKTSSPKEDEVVKGSPRENEITVDLTFTQSSKESVYNSELEVTDTKEEVWEVFDNIMKKYKINGYVASNTGSRLSNASGLVNGGKYRIYPIVRAG